MIPISSDIKLSVIVPVYNVEKHLCACIDSLMRSSSEAYEIILIDDGSKDGSPGICDDYAKRYKNISVVHQQNGGLAAARNTGIRSAKGEYLTFIDSDDRVDDGYIDFTEPYLNGDDIIVLGYHIDQIEAGYTDTKILPDAASVSAAEALRMTEENGTFNMVWNKLYRRALLSAEPCTLFEPGSEPGEDLIFNCRCFCKAQKITTVGKAYYHWIRRGEDTLANRFRPDLTEKNRMFIEYRCRLYRELGTEQTDAQLLAKGNVAYVFGCIPNMYREGHIFPLKDRLGFYREILSSQDIARWVDEAAASNKLISQFCRLYRRRSARLMDAYYSTALMMRRRCSKLWERNKKKLK